jgi:hypothetical protein
MKFTFAEATPAKIAEASDIFKRHAILFMLKTVTPLYFRSGETSPKIEYRSPPGAKSTIYPWVSENQYH